MNLKPSWFTLVALDKELRSEHSISNLLPSEIAGDLGFREELASLKKPEQRLLAWLGRFAPESFSEAHSKERLFFALNIFLAFVLGSLMASAVLTYSGEQPINIFACLLAFFVLPLIGSALSLIGFLPSWIPLSGLFKSLSPSRALLGRFRAFKASVPSFDLKKAFLVYVNQFGVFFFAGAICSFLVLLTVSDLAFGWSSTIVKEPERVVKIVQTISAPWEGFLPSAVPSEELVQETRFFRLNRAELTGVQAETFSAWWPFLLVSLIVYGLVPRLAMLVLASILSKRELSRQHLALPRAKSLLWKLQDSSLELLFKAGESRAESSASSGESGISESSGPIAKLSKLPKNTCLVSWALDMDKLSLEKVSGFSEDWPRYSLATSSEADEEEVIAAVSRLKPEAICFLVKAWSTPTDEIIDIARNFSSVSPVTVLPIVPKDESLLPGDSKNLGVWYRRVEKEAHESLLIRSL